MIMFNFLDVDAKSNNNRGQMPHMSDFENKFKLTDDHYLENRHIMAIYNPVLMKFCSRLGL